MVVVKSLVNTEYSTEQKFKLRGVGEIKYLKHLHCISQ